jgi:murein DD-endopeptidase MepM/ murein hydrolase activator NlpD
MPLELPFDRALNPRPGGKLMSHQGLPPARTHQHNGIDLSGHTGDPVINIAAGTVERVCNYVPGTSCCGGYGNTVLVKHGDDLFSFYAHLSRIDVVEGSTIPAGVSIGLVGKTFSGQQPPCTLKRMVSHLHFEIRHADGSRYDVLQVLAAGGLGLDEDAYVVEREPFDYTSPYIAAALEQNPPEEIIGSSFLRWGRWSSVGVPVALVAGIAATVAVGVWIVRRQSSR